MRRILIAIGIMLITPMAYAALAQLDHYQPGFRTINGSQLNKMVDVVNSLSAANPSALRTVAGETALDGSNPTPVTSGLTAITACHLTIKTSTAPGVSTSVVTYTTSAGALSMYGWKVTATGDATLIASTGTDTIGWVCVGT